MRAKLSLFLVVANGAAVFATLGWLLFGAGGVLAHQGLWAWHQDGDPGLWPEVLGQRLSIRLDPPGGFLVDAELELAGVDGPFGLLLNKQLHVTAATERDRTPVAVAHGLPLYERYHREGRVVLFTPQSVPADGRMTLFLSYAGEGASGTRGSDWRGILFVDVDQVRMCEQTIFWPQVPLAPESTAVMAAPTELLVDAPAELEFYAPGTLLSRALIDGDGDEDQERRLWHFRTERASVPSLVGGRRLRGEVSDGNGHMVTLLRPENADLQQAFLDETERAFQYFTERFGPTREGSLGIFEQQCRSASSYNWAAEGLIVFDSGAINDEVPVAKLAHEVAHLWFGQRLDGQGDGERFLTESLAEAAAWRYLRSEGQLDELERKLGWARKNYRSIADSPDNIPLRDVQFGVDWYNTLAYEKGALVAWYLMNTLGEDAFDGVVRGLPTGILTLDTFLAALDEAAGEHAFEVPWIDHGGDLSLSVGDVEWNGDAGQLEARITATPVPADAPFEARGQLQVRVRTDGRQQDHAVELTGTMTRVVLPLEREPSSVVFDPDGVWPLSAHTIVVRDGARLVSSLPTQGAERLAHAGTRIELEFDRPLAPIDAETLRQRAGRFVEEGARVPPLRSIEWLEEGRRLVLETRAWYPDRHYQLPLRACLTDTHGGPVFTPVFGFRTSPSGDTTPPKIIATVPAFGATGVSPELAAVRVTFDEPMKTMTGFHNSDIAQLRREGNEYPEFAELSWSDDGLELVLEIAEPLQPGKTYVLPFRSKRWHDVSGNGLTPYDVTFTVSGGE